jgi:hypothetical protein
MAHMERQVVVSKRGSLVLPSTVRAEQGRGLLAKLEPTDRPVVDDLLAERRREDARERSA